MSSINLLIALIALIAIGAFTYWITAPKPNRSISNSNNRTPKKRVRFNRNVSYRDLSENPTLLSESSIYSTPSMTQSMTPTRTPAQSQNPTPYSAMESTPYAPFMKHKLDGERYADAMSEFIGSQEKTQKEIADAYNKPDPFTKAFYQKNRGKSLGQIYDEQVAGPKMNTKRVRKDYGIGTGCYNQTEYMFEYSDENEMNSGRIMGGDLEAFVPGGDFSRF